MSKRLQKIREKWSDARLSTLPGIRKETSLLTSAAIFQAVVDADPTPNHKYVDWTLRTWETGAFQWEDIRSRQHSRVADQLKRFELNKHRIPDPAMRSLLKYRSPGELDDIMDRHNVPRTVSEFDLSSNQHKKLLMAKARLESHHIKLGNGVTMDIPLTQFSSCILGRNTRWCTAARQDNLFADYAEYGPLLILTLPTGQRFQGHADIHDYVSSHTLGDTLDDHNYSDDYPEDLSLATIQNIAKEVINPNTFEIRNENDVLINDNDIQVLAPYKEELADFIAKAFLSASKDFISDVTENENIHNAVQQRIRECLLDYFSNAKREVARTTTTAPTTQQSLTLFQGTPNKPGHYSITQETIEHIPDALTALQELITSMEPTSIVLSLPKTLTSDFMKAIFTDEIFQRADTLIHHLHLEKAQYDILSTMLSDNMMTLEMNKRFSYRTLSTMLKRLPMENLEKLYGQFIREQKGYSYEQAPIIKNIAKQTLMETFSTRCLAQCRTLDEFVERIEPGAAGTDRDNIIQDTINAQRESNLENENQVTIPTHLHEDIIRWGMSSPDIRRKIFLNIEDKLDADEMRMLSCLHAYHMVGASLDTKITRELNVLSLNIMFDTTKKSSDTARIYVLGEAELNEADIKGLTEDQQEALLAIGKPIGRNQGSSGLYVYPSDETIGAANYDCNQNRSTYRRSVALGLGSLEDMENLKNNVITKDMVNRAEQRINTLFEMRNHHLAQDLISRCRNFDMDEDVSQNFDIDRDISRHLDKIEDAHMETMAILTGMRREILKNEMTILDTSPSLR